MVLPPALIMFVGAALIAGLRGRARDVAVLVVPIATLFFIWQVPDGAAVAVPFLGHELVPLEGGALSRLFATIFAVMAFTGGLFALKQPNRLELPAAMVYGGAAIGVCFAGDLVTLFVFWEVMALASLAVIWSAGTATAYGASMRYVLVHFLGGMILLVGIVAYVAETGSLAFVAMRPESPATWAILAGFLLNAGAPPVSAWLSDAYPEASFSGTVFLSGFTTKTAVYVLLRGFPGAEILIPIGCYMIFHGIIYALLENDMRRILAYSIINQVGFMVVGVGIGTEMALNGAAAHAFTHIIYKALLLMSAGSVLLMNGGRRKCTDLGGLFKSMPYTAAMGIVGALAISSFPLTSGFISKSMISQGAADQHLTWLWLGLAAASAGVFLHAGIKFPWFVFFQKDSGRRPAEPPLNMKLAMGLFAFLCIALGVYPDPLYALLPYSIDYVPYTTGHVVAMLQLLLFSGLAFFLLLGLMRRSLTVSLDLDWFYRRAGPWAWRRVEAVAVAFHGALWRGMEDGLATTIRALQRHHGPRGILARTWPTGSMAIWAAALLGGALLVYFR